ncbi:hypothetical protein F383_36644 [Gossypium arboreum]|uniref:Uncharacterized protein n=1 Tax=Gossypium arboreum TaxID=29729 RepID=A0A0B0MF34_GOSAR|nr:hypothetical protein F383_36644 [Gossypium arboreum]
MWGLNHPTHPYTPGSIKYGTNSNLQLCYQYIRLKSLSVHFLQI